MNEIYLGGGDNFTIQTSTNVELRETLSILIENGKSIDLDIKVIADFKNIPERYHEVCLNMLTTKYYGRVSFGDNPFSKCTPPTRKKWWMVWK
jgi:hypothetical protein